jgi:hypothetical protein
MKLVGYKSPGRRATRAKLRTRLAVAKNCPAIFAEDKEFMSLFRQSKRLEGLKGKAAELAKVMDKLKSRGWWLEKHAAAEGRHAG